jgi:hypothetical protein
MELRDGLLLVGAYLDRGSGRMNCLLVLLYRKGRCFLALVLKDMVWNSGWAYLRPKILLTTDKGIYAG